MRHEHTDAGDPITIRAGRHAAARRRLPEADKATEAELLADLSERAEHLMLIDLARNDIGMHRAHRLGQGDRGLRHRALLARVMHTVRTLRQSAQGRPEQHGRAARHLPGRHADRAPKIRAMEIIDEPQAGRRGIYGGACGYLELRRRHGRGHRHPHRHRAEQHAVHCGPPPAWWPIRQPELGFGARPSTRQRALIRAAELVEEGVLTAMPARARGFCAIDFGTSNQASPCCRARACAWSSWAGYPTMPTAVFYASRRWRRMRAEAAVRPRRRCRPMCGASRAA